MNALRARQVRNFLTTLLLSQGVPMLLAGDEIGRTQQSGNNAYSQDNQIAWLDGEEMTDADWNSGYAKSIAVFLNGDQIPSTDAHGERITDASFLVLVNAYWDPLAFTIAAAVGRNDWVPVVDTASVTLPPAAPISDVQVRLAGRSLVVLRR